MFLVNRQFAPMFRARNHEQAHEQTRQRIEDTVRSSARQVNERIHQLEQEWDVGRATSALMSAIVLTGLVLGIGVSPWWLLLSLLGGGALFLLSMVGWCPMMSVCSALGFRTATEIAGERFALKALRGDFHRLAGIQTPEDREAIAAMVDEGGPAYEYESPDAAEPHVVREAMDAVHR